MPCFDPNIATDAVALIVKLADGRINKVAVLKLLYFAERQAIAEGSMITRSTFFSLQRGPVSSEVLDLINGKTSSTRWSEYLATVGDDVVLKQEPCDDYLCDAHDEWIRKHWGLHAGTFGPLAFPTALVEYSNTLPEWQDPGDNERVPISHEDILRAHNLAPEHIAEILEGFDDLYSWLSCWEKSA